MARLFLWVLLHHCAVGVYSNYTMLVLTPFLSTRIIDTPPLLQSLTRAVISYNQLRHKNYDKHNQTIPKGITNNAKLHTRTILPCAPNVHRGILQIRMRLIYSKDKTTVSQGDVVYIHRKKHVITNIQKPHKPESTGRVYVQAKGETHSSSYYPSVIGAEWIEREDQ